MAISLGKCGCGYVFFTRTKTVRSQEANNVCDNQEVLHYLCNRLWDVSEIGKHEIYKY